MLIYFHYEDSVVLQSGKKTKDILFTSVAGKDSFDLKTINQSLYNAYKIGKLGAKPALGSPFILNE